MTRVLCFGIAVADRIYALAALPSGEGKVTATGYRESGGGIAATGAVTVAALGGHGVFCGALGSDSAGRFVKYEMDRLGVDLSGLDIQHGQRTPSACGLVDRAGERCLVVDRGTVRPMAPDPARLNGAGALLVDHRFPQEAMQLLRSATPDLPTVFDGEGGEPADLRALAALATVPVFSRPGLQATTGLADPAEALRHIHAPRALAVGVTLGTGGSLWRIGDAQHHVPAFPVAVRDTTGCGDVFHGAIALALAEGQGILLAIRFATAAAALKARNGLGWDGMPGRAEVLDLLGKPSRC